MQDDWKSMKIIRFYLTLRTSSTINSESAIKTSSVNIFCYLGRCNRPSFNQSQSRINLYFNQFHIPDPNIYVGNIVLLFAVVFNLTNLSVFLQIRSSVVRRILTDLLKASDTLLMTAV